MAEPIDDSSLAAHLCGELLTAAELRQLCLARGFPITGGSKEALATSTAARLLEPRGLSEAMARLELPWCRVLHLAAACGGALGLDWVARVLDPTDESWTGSYRDVWRQVVSGLLTKGVALATEDAAPNGARGRHARFQLVLPEAFRPALPSYPIQVEPVSSEARISAPLDDLLEAALHSFVQQ